MQFPEGASKDAVAAIKAIIRAVGKQHTDEVMRAFKTPEEWEARGEDYGHGSVLIVVHDGPPLSDFFNLSYCDHEAHDKVQTALGKLGLYAGQCTGWYSAIYRD